MCDDDLLPDFWINVAILVQNQFFHSEFILFVKNQMLTFLPTDPWIWYSKGTQIKYFIGNQMKRDYFMVLKLLNSIDAINSWRRRDLFSHHLEESNKLQTIMTAGCVEPQKATHHKMNWRCFIFSLGEWIHTKLSVTTLQICNH